MFLLLYGFEYMVCWMVKNGKFWGDYVFVEGFRNKLFEGLVGLFFVEIVFFDFGVLNI